MLARLAPSVPMVAIVLTVLSYVSGIPPSLASLSPGASAILAGGLVTFLAWLIVAFLGRRFASAPLADVDEYGQLQVRIVQLEARLAAPADSARLQAELAAPADGAPADGAPSPADLAELAAAQAEALTEASDLRTLIDQRLAKPGLAWVLAIGYIHMWIALHRAEEALFITDPTQTVIGDAIYDELRLEGSDVAHSDEILTMLRHAIRVLDPSAARLYLSMPDTGHDKSDFAGADPLVARQALRKIRRGLNEYRDELYAGLVRARNEFLKTLFITGTGAYILLILLILRGLEVTVIEAGSIFFAFGALVGLLARIRSESQSDKAVEDFGLTAARLLAAPLYSGLAATFGVLLVGLAHLSIGTISLGPAPTGGGTIPTLRQIFSLGLNPIGFLAAGLFGLTPSLLFDYLKSQTDAFRTSIKSSQPTGATPAKTK